MLSVILISLREYITVYSVLLERNRRRRRTDRRSTGGQFKFATGGFIRGPGTGTSDSINARLSNGEFVVNAQATRNNLGALHAINNGQNVSGGEVNVNNSFQLNGDFNEQSQQAIQQYMPDIADSVEYALRERGVIQ